MIMNKDVASIVTQVGLESAELSCKIEGVE